MKILLVGAGLANASLLHYLRLSPAFQNSTYTVVDKRNHLGGNCFTYQDTETGVNVHAYGPHIFNADSQLAWGFMCQYLEMHPYVNRVKAHTNSGIYSLPINLHTINQFFSTRLNPAQAREWMMKQTEQYRNKTPKNFEEAMLAHLGKPIYEEFIYGYTAKQWGVDPCELPASIAKRLPFRLSYDDNYYNKRYQGIPKEGYTPLFEKIFYQKDVDIRLNCSFEHAMAKEYDLIVYTGSIDEYFNYDLGRLSYRTVYWEKGTCDTIFQGTAVMNYTSINTAWTRINEPMFFEPWRSEYNGKSIYFSEFSKATSEGDIPYYPMRLAKDMQLFNKYQSRLQDLKSNGIRNIIFNGRLGTYQYLDMDKIIENSAYMASVALG